MPIHPQVKIDGLFGPVTGIAMGQSYLNETLSAEWISSVPSSEPMTELQRIILSHHPVDIDGLFGPATGKALGNMIENGQYIPPQETNDDAIAILKSFEGNGKPGKPFQAYICPTGHPTIGWGNTSSVSHQDVMGQKTITEDEAEQLLRKDLTVFEDAVRSSLRVPIGSNMFGACVLLAYNIGSSGFSKSTVLRKINERDFQAAAIAFEMWNKGRVDGRMQIIHGLVRRRKAERELFKRDI